MKVENSCLFSLKFMAQTLNSCHLARSKISSELAEIKLTKAMADLRMDNPCHWMKLDILSKKGTKMCYEITEKTKTYEEKNGKDIQK